MTEAVSMIIDEEASTSMSTNIELENHSPWEVNDAFDFDEKDPLFSQPIEDIQTIEGIKSDLAISALTLEERTARIDALKKRIDQTWRLIDFLNALSPAERAALFNYWAELSGSLDQYSDEIGEGASMTNVGSQPAETTPSQSNQTNLREGVQPKSSTGKRIRGKGKRRA